MEMDKTIEQIRREFDLHIVPLLLDLYEGKADKGIIIVAVYDWLTTTLSQVRRDAYNEGKKESSP